MEKENHKQQIEDIYTIGLDLLRNWWVILCIAISISLWGYIGASVVYHPQYTSSTTFVVTAKETSSGAYASLYSAQKLTDTFQAVLNSDVLKKKVAEALEQDSFIGSVDISNVEDTNLLTVSVTSDSPDVSFKELRGVLENYEDVSGKVLGEVVMEIFEEPNFPSEPTNEFSGNRVQRISFQISLLLVLLFFAIASFQKDSVKSEEDVSEKLDTTMFALLEHERHYRNLRARFRRKKKKGLITEPSVSFGYVETIKKMRTKLMYQRRKNNIKVLLVTSAGKKEGKSTVAANLAIAMAQRNKKVLLIEGDLKNVSMAKLFGIRLTDEAGMGADFETENIASKIVKWDNTSLYLLVNRVSHARSSEILGSATFAEFLELMKKEMDYIIIDGPAAIGRADAEILARLSDQSLLVVKQNDVKVPYINDTIDMLEMYGKGLAGCVFNNVYTGGAVISSGYGYGSYGRYGNYENYYAQKPSKEKDSRKRTNKHNVDFDE